MNVLRNKDIELHLADPLENYHLSRFDWTGKIEKVLFQGKQVSGMEIDGQEDSHEIGKGFYNEFGIEKAIGFEDIQVGEWFHKIGVGLLKKDGPEYDFAHHYKIKPAKFDLNCESEKAMIRCTSTDYNGYAYQLHKKIRLLENGFVIEYRLINLGERPIITDEYNHNFIALPHEDKSYNLKFAFKLQEEKFDEFLDSEDRTNIGFKEVNFKAPITEPFFISNLSGNEEVKAEWEMENLRDEFSLKESGDFTTGKINLWGWKKVVSPELFYDVHIEPGKFLEWKRTYTFQSRR
jgi:hypothetical protein